MYSYKKTFRKGVKYFIFFALPFAVTSFIDNFPEVANLSIGTGLLMFSNFLKHR